MPLRKHWPAILGALALFFLNAWVCRELFSAGFLHNSDSNEGAFVALSRFYREHMTDLRWYPRVDGGMPIENAYQPLLPALAAATGALSGWSVERAFHFVLALTYCLGPVTLFWFAWEFSESIALAFAAGTAYSLTSFAELLIPILRVPVDGHLAPLRLYNLIHYAEDPHNLALTLLPVALLFLRRAMLNPSALHRIAAVLSCAVVVASNAFGAVDLAIGGICLVLALRKGSTTLLLTGLASYLFMCPWLPPSLIRLILQDQFSARGSFTGDLRTLALQAGLIATVAAMLWLSRRLRPAERFSLLFAPWMVLFPVAFFLWNIALVPQSNRYQLELEMALCLLGGCGVARLLELRPSWIRATLLLTLTILAGLQTKHFRHFAKALLQPLEITQTTDYKLTLWLNDNQPGQRAMLSGDASFLFNVLSDNPQLGGGHEPQVPNWMNLAALYTIYAGVDPPARDAEYSIFWLKAFGVQAITLPGPLRNARKFDGVLPILWQDGPGRIYRIPQSSTSLAHVIPRETITTKRPLHGLDLQPARAFVAALDNPNLPQATLLWNGNSHFTVRAPLNRDQVLHVQVTWAPGWEAVAQGHQVPVHSDALGLLVAEPDCRGDCTVDFHFGVTPEAWACRILSALTTLALMTLALMTLPTLAPAARKKL